MIVSLPELPKRKYNSPRGQYVCWSCQATKPLIKVEGGYACINCKHLGKPTANKSSFKEFKYKNHD